MVGICEDLIEEVEDLAVDGGFEEQHELTIALAGAERLEVLQRRSAQPPTLSLSRSPPTGSPDTFPLLRES